MTIIADLGCNPHYEFTVVSDVAHILNRVQQGDPKATGELLPLVYEELRRLAAQKMALEQPGQTLQPTALVHEAWLRLRPCGEFWSNAPARRPARAMAVD